MKSSFPSRTSCCLSSQGSANGTSVSPGDGAKDNILAGYLQRLLSTAPASQRSVYEAGIYKVKLDRSSAESTSSSRSVLSLTDSDGCLIRSPTRRPGPGAALLQSAAALCQSALTSCRSFDGRGGGSQEQADQGSQFQTGASY